MKLFSKAEHVPMFIGILFSFIGGTFFVIGIASGIFYAKTPTFRGNFFLFPLVFGGIGLLFLILGICFLTIARKQKKNRLQLIETGEQVLAEVTDCFIDYSVRINHRHPYCLNLKYYDPFSGRTLVFTSGAVMNPNNYLGRQLTVYVDRNNPDRYYVEV